MEKTEISKVQPSLSYLMKKIAIGEMFSKREKIEFNRLLKVWHEKNCPPDMCRANTCSFAIPSKWILEQNFDDLCHMMKNFCKNDTLKSSYKDIWHYGKRLP